MKNNFIKLSLGVVLTFAFMSCNNNEELAGVKPQSTQSTSDILIFKSDAEFDSTFQKVNAMSVEARSSWEKSKGFKSFGTTCDQVYGGINPENFKSLQQVKDTVAKLGEYLEIGQTKEGQYFVDPKESGNPMRYLINKDKMYIIKDSVFKKFDEGTVVMSTSAIEELKKVKSIKNLQASKNMIVRRNVANIDTRSSVEFSNEIYSYVNFIQGKRHFMLRVKLNTWQVTSDSKSYRYIQYSYSNYKMTAWVYWDERQQVSSTVSAYGSDAKSLWGQMLDYRGYTYSYGESSSNTIENDAAHPFANNYQSTFGDPYFLSYNIYAKSDRGCFINVTYTRQ